MKEKRNMWRVICGAFAGKINIWLPSGTYTLEIYMDWKIGG